MDDGAISLVGLFDVYQPPQLPRTELLTCAMRFHGEPGESATIGLFVKDPEGLTISRKHDPREMVVKIPAATVSGFAQLVVVDFAQAGPHTLAVTVNGEEVAEIALPVVAAAEVGGPAHVVADGETENVVRRHRSPEKRKGLGARLLVRFGTRA